MKQDIKVTAGWIEVSLDLKMLTLSANLTSSGSIFQSWPLLYVKVPHKTKIKFGRNAKINTISS